MTRYTAHARREGRYWVLDVEGVGVTQALNLDEAKEMVASLVVALVEVPLKSFNVVVIPTLGPEITAQIAEVKAAVAELDVQQRSVSQKSRTVVRALLGKVGVTGRDAAVILGVSPQRISQLRADVV